MLLTCHDALYATPDAIQTVVEGLFIQFEQQYGVRPNTQTDDYTDYDFSHQPARDMLQLDYGYPDTSLLLSRFADHLGSFLQVAEILTRNGVKQLNDVDIHHLITE